MLFSFLTTVSSRNEMSMAKGKELHRAGVRLSLAVAVSALICLGTCADARLDTAVSNVSSMTGMEYVALGGGAAPKTLAGPVADAGASAQWFECADDPQWFTNSVGDKISFGQYAAMVNVEGGEAAAVNFNAKYRRCDAATTILLVGRAFGEKCCCDDDGKIEEASGQVAYQGWKLGDELYLLLVEDDTGSMKMRSYVFCLDDGKTARRLVVFDYEPSNRQIESVVAARINPSALNNVAAMIYNAEASRGVAADEYIVKLFEKAALGGEPAACRNLAYYYGKRKESARSSVWSKLAATVARRRNRNAKLRLERRPVSEWPHILGDEDKRIPSRGSATSRPCSQASARSVPSARSVRRAAARRRSPRPAPSPKPLSA